MHVGIKEGRADHRNQVQSDPSNLMGHQRHRPVVRMLLRLGKDNQAQSLLEAILRSRLEGRLRL